MSDTYFEENINNNDSNDKEILVMTSLSLHLSAFLIKELTVEKKELQVKAKEKVVELCDFFIETWTNKIDSDSKQQLSYYDPEGVKALRLKESYEKMKSDIVKMINGKKEMVLELLEN